MSNKSKSSKALDRPFDPALLCKAKALAANCEIILWQEEGRFYGHGLEFPHVYGDGDTAEKAVEGVREAMVAATAYMLEVGDRPPVPAQEQTRNVQVNIRMNAEEKEIITPRAKQKGFRSISGYMRSVATG